MPKNKEVVPVAQSAAAVEQATLSLDDRRRLSQVILTEATTAPFKVPKDTKALITRVRELGVGRENDTAELAALLHEAESRGLPRENGFKSLADYAESAFGIHGARARGLAASYRQFLNLGLNPAILAGRQGVSFNKFMTLAGAVREETINGTNITEWLCLLRKDGPGAMPQDQIKKEVSRLRPANENSDALIGWTIRIPANMRDGLTTTVNVLREALKASTDGEVVVQALGFLASQYQADLGQAASQAGLVYLREAAAAIAPVTPVFVCHDTNHTLETLGVPPVFSVYVNKSGACLAVSKEEAEAALGGQVTELSLTVAASMKSQIETMRATAAPPVVVIDEKVVETTAAAVTSPEAAPDIAKPRVRVRRATSTTTEAAHAAVPVASAPAAESAAVSVEALPAPNVGAAVNVRISDGSIKTGTVLEVLENNTKVRVSTGRGRPRTMLVSELLPVEKAPSAVAVFRKAAADAASAAAPAPAAAAVQTLQRPSTATTEAEITTLRHKVEAAGTLLQASGHSSAVSAAMEDYRRTRDSLKQANVPNADLDALSTMLESFVATAAKTGLTAALNKALASVK